MTKPKINDHHKKLSLSEAFLANMFQKAWIKAEVMTSNSEVISIQLSYRTTG